MIRRAEQFLFYLLIFSIPFQARKILWQQSWYFNEWQSISIYATDVLLMILFVFWFFAGKKIKIEKADYFLVVFVLVSAISIKNSSNFVLSSYNLLKLVEFVFFYFYLKNYAVKKFGFSRSLAVLIAGGLFQSVIAIVQFLNQSDVGLRIIGESIIDSNMTGVASFYNKTGEKIIRAYGSTPHPNVLAGYLFLSVFGFYFLWIYKRVSKIYVFVYALILLAFFFTFARVAVFLLFVNFLIRVILVRFGGFKKEYWKKKLIPLFLTTFIVVLFFSLFYWPEAVSRIKISPREEAVQLRIFYNKESLSSLNWFGVGSGDFVNWLMVRNPNLPRNLYQPTHNLYLLIFSETGIFGISSFILFIVFLVKDFIIKTKMEKLHHYSFLLIFSSFLFLGLFDHFLWTLQQGRFMFWMVLALLSLGWLDTTHRKLNSDLESNKID